MRGPDFTSSNIRQVVDVVLEQKLDNFTVADTIVTRLEKWSARGRRIRPLDGNDITNFHQAGGNLRAWIEYHLDRDDRQRVERLEAEAPALIEAGLPTPRSRRRYAEIAEALGLPYSGLPWHKWAEKVADDPGI
jgi:hypothetical protein